MSNATRTTSFLRASLAASLMAVFAGCGAMGSNDSGGGYFDGSFDGGTGAYSGTGGIGGTGGVSGTGGMGFDSGVHATKCDNACCPTASECYFAGNPGVGAECMAQTLNMPTRFQLRQVWSRDRLPLGLSSSQTYTTRLHASELPWASCNMSDGTGDFIELLDVDLSVARRGYAAAASLSTARADGLCFFEGVVFDDAWALRSNLGDASAYPRGLPPPEAQPWVVRPQSLERVVADFDVGTDRVAMLSSLDESAFDGVFYFDGTAGRWHGYTPLEYRVWYENGAPVVVPVREVESEFTFNDPKSPECVGALRAPSSGCTSTSPTDAPWGCLNDACPGEGPATSRGYLLITELEQVFSTALGATLCAASPATPSVTGGSGDAGATDAGGSRDAGGARSSCRGSPEWNPSDPVSGLPMGDWCAATNAPASSTCHDAYRFETFQAFAAFPIRDAECRTAPAAEAAASACPGTALALGPGDAKHIASDGVALAPSVGTMCSDGPDRGGIWALTASEAGSLRVDVAPFPDSGVAFDGSISLRSQCSDARTTSQCSSGVPLRKIETRIDTGQTVYLVVQSSSAFDVVVSLDTASCGDGVVNAGEDCDYGDTRAGDGCDETCHFEAPDSSDICPGEVTTIAPAEERTLYGHTINYADDYAAPCGARSGGPDRVFGINPTKTGVLHLDLRSAFDGVLSVYAKCQAPELQGLLHCSDGPRADDTESMDLDVVGGSQYFVVVDGYLPSSYGPFALTVRLDSGP